ncbi:MAG: epoxyqueuosine reductase QueH [Deltaproteobacteria bacterium]|nr:epoxyqueuosine reductase QueH [Deltaproteobacteria bacterium]
MKILLHICCAPCTIYPLRILREGGDEVSGLYYNPNIHPYMEYRRRWEALEPYAEREGLSVIREEGYPLETFLRQVAFREEARCQSCYELRLKNTARLAAQRGFDAFTSTLLYSRFQKHDLIRSVGEAVARAQGIAFLYRDFRDGWSEGVRISKELGMYRQPYCGCIYSEKERYCPIQGKGAGAGRGRA